MMNKINNFSFELGCVIFRANKDKNTYNHIPETILYEMKKRFIRDTAILT